MRSSATWAASAAGVLLLSGVPSMQGQRTTSSGVPTAAIDHLVLGISSLQAGVEAFEARTGVRAVYGGKHPGVGTENALVSLGDGRYVELIAPTSPTVLAHPTFGNLHPLATLTPVGWAVHTADLPAMIGVLRTQGFTVGDPRPGARDTPDGKRLSWMTAPISGDGLELTPFLIAWSRKTAHPSTTSPTGCRLVRVVAIDPAPSRLGALLKALGVDVALENGPRRHLRFVLSCPRGEVTFE